MSLGFIKDLNQSQQKAATFPNQPLLILAGAGSGKTRVLTARAAWLILKKRIVPNNILLVTFTNKAAEEMKNRIEKIVKSQSPFAGTFHSFCAQILRKEGQYLGIVPNYLIYDKTDQLDLIKQVMGLLNISSQQFKPNSILATNAAYRASK